MLRRGKRNFFENRRNKNGVSNTMVKVTYGLESGDQRLEYQSFFSFIQILEFKFRSSQTSQ